MHDNFDLSLESLGWRPFFASQLAIDSISIPARVVGVHRSAVVIVGEDFEASLPAPRSDKPGADEQEALTIGDWVLVDPSHERIVGRLERFGLFKRRAAGSERRLQLIAANVDTLFVVTSANRDFNPARIERYLALAREGAATPVVVVTKADLNADAAMLAAEAARLAPGLVAECLDARSPEIVDQLAPWLASGQTVALAGSSGVGKSTLINSLTDAGIAVGEIRAADQRGRHSTTARSMHRLPGGAWLVDTPGMRELGLVDADEAIDDVFAEITQLALECRFGDCGHGSEPGCAVRLAVERGELDPARLARFSKLAAETRRNSESLHERRARLKSQGRFYKAVLQSKHSRRTDT
jgi:ribosome biogenesis GTPase